VSSLRLAIYRMMIFGNAGGGKSTLARELARITC
jgi:adenylate kinase family enzyme